MKRIPWTLLFSLLAGLGLGLAYSWLISPVRVVDSQPIALRADFKDQYRSAIAGAYIGTGNLERAKARLSLLGDADPIRELNIQAQRLLASGDFQSADKIALLSSALVDTSIDVISPPPPQSANKTEIPATLLPSTSIPTLLNLFTETPEFIPTQTVVIESTPRPTRTPTPTHGAPFTLIGQESICDANLPDGLLQVLVLNSKRKQLAGIEIRVTWDSGNEQFFTGLKPELGNGYADFIMSSDINYTVQLAQGSDIASGLIAPSCQTPTGDLFSGGFKLTFQQP